jgi:hypothetical protein
MEELFNLQHRRASPKNGAEQVTPPLLLWRGEGESGLRFIQHKHPVFKQQINGDRQ